MSKLRHIGGTPVAEGVRLETGTSTVFAVRNEDRDISVRTRREPRGFLRALLKIPLVRGIVRMIRDICRYFDGINESSELSPQQIVRGTAIERGIASFLYAKPQTIVAWGTAILVPILAVLCLWAAPLGAEAMLGRYASLTRGATNAIVCAIRIVCFLACIWLWGRLRVVNRLRMYRGALNKVNNCYEHREELTVENAEQYPIIARRSEGAFLLCVLIVSMALFALLRPAAFYLAALYRVGIVLGVAAVLGEVLDALERSEMTTAVRIVRIPYDLLQRMIVIDPHPQMLEVAICAFKAALDSQNEVGKHDHR